MLPSGSEDDDEEEPVDAAFMKGPLADQMSKPMSKLKGAAFERQRDVGGMERKLMKMRADAGLAAAGGATIGQTQEKIYKEVHKIRRQQRSRRTRRAKPAHGLAEGSRGIDLV